GRLWHGLSCAKSTVPTQIRRGRCQALLATMPATKTASHGRIAPCWAVNTLQRVMATYRLRAKQRRLPPLREAYSDRVLYEDEPLIPIFEGKHSDGQLRSALIVWRRLIATGPVRLATASRHRR